MEVVTARSEIDTSRPFQSVREAVEVFGGDRPCASVVSRAASSSESSSKFSVRTGSGSGSGSPSSSLLAGCLKKLEEDLAEARSELVSLKQRQSQMEMAVSSITVQLGDGLGVDLSSGLIRKGKELAVADAGSAAAMVGAEHAEEEEDGNRRVRSDRWDETRAEEWVASLEYLPSLSEALTIKMVEEDLGERRKVKNNKAKKKQHKKHKRSATVSLVGGFFSKKDKSK